MLPVGSRAGLLWGLAGVGAFSFTVPLTRVAVGGLSPLFIGSGRAVGAAVLAGAALALTRQRLPRGSQWHRLALSQAGLTLGLVVMGVALLGQQFAHRRRRRCEAT